MLTREPLSEQVKSHVRHQIVGGEYEPETKVGIAQVAEELGVSPTPVREAFAQLVSEGFLTLSPNRGFYVRPLDIEEVGGLLPILSTLEDLALRTVPPVDAEQAATLRELNRQLLESVKHSAVRAMLVNQQWHATLMERCGNRELQRVIAQLRARTFRYEYVYYKFQQDDVEEQARQHDEILTALERGDRRLAREVMSKHWDHNLQLMVPSGHENEG